MTNEEMFTALIARMDSMESGLNKRLDRLESRMDRLESRMDGLEARMDGLETRMDRLESRMDGLESRMDRLESRMDGLETRMDGLETRMDSLETRVERLEVRIDKLESDMNMEFQAVRIEMDVVNKSLKKDISILNDKIDRIMFIKDVDGYEKMKIQVNLLTQGYQELKEKIG